MNTLKVPVSHFKKYTKASPLACYTKSTLPANRTYQDNNNTAKNVMNYLP